MYPTPYSGVASNQAATALNQSQQGMAVQSFLSSPGEHTPLNDFTYMSAMGGIYGAEGTTAGADTGWEVDKFAHALEHPFQSFLAKMAASKAPMKLLAGGVAAAAGATGLGVAAKDHLEHQKAVADARANYRNAAMAARLATSPSYQRLSSDERANLLASHASYQQALVDAAGHDPLYATYM